MLNTLKKKLNKKKGFTLMEMLIVVAIIAILIAIAIPTFSSQLEKAREASDQANIRSAYAIAQASTLLEKYPDGTALPTTGTVTSPWYLNKDGSVASAATNAYAIQAKGPVSVSTVPISGSTTFDKGDTITIVWDGTNSIWKVAPSA